YEINSLMELLVSALSKEINDLNKNKVQLTTIGDIKSLPSKCRNELQRAMSITKQNDKLILILALSYSSRWEIVSAIKRIVQKTREGLLTPEDITADLVSAHLATAGIPDPELMIRTSGEYRLSNFLLWQMAYTELYFTDVLWPDIRKGHIIDAISEFQKRERRFGKTTGQIRNKN
ncbi:MAG: polyprenyl diphosphate synthase, partial [Flavobacteriales bacterium]